MQKNTLTIVLAAAVWLSGGCSCEEGVPAQPAGARPHYANPRKDMSRIARIVLLEPINRSTNPQISVDFTKALSKALDNKSLFGQLVVLRSEPTFIKYQMDYEKYPLETLKTVHKDLGCDAILSGVITDYQTYPRMTISLKLKLVDLTDGELIWAMEQVWDTTDRNIEARLKGFFDQEMRCGYEPLNWKMGMVSPIVFNKFVSYEVAETFTSYGQESERLYRLEAPGTSK
jgi:hypothetical protein